MNCLLALLLAHAPSAAVANDRAVKGAWVTITRGDFNPRRWTVGFYRQDSVGYVFCVNSPENPNGPHDFSVGLCRSVRSYTSVVSGKPYTRYYCVRDVVVQQSWWGFWRESDENESAGWYWTTRQASVYDLRFGEPSRGPERK